MIKAKQKGISPYELINEEIAQSVIVSNGLIFLPYLLGERSPSWNPDSKGAFIGFKMEHKRAHILRNVIERGSLLILILSRKEYLLDKDGERIRLKSGEVKTSKVDMVDWNEQVKAEEWRAAWADAVNAVLERQGLEERVDHRSFLRQGKEEIPTVHLGVAAAQMERKGIQMNEPCNNQNKRG